MTRNHQMPLRKVVKAINSIKVGDRVRKLDPSLDSVDPRNIEIQWRRAGLRCLAALGKKGLGGLSNLA